jgi:hypothetical protein
VRRQDDRRRFRRRIVGRVLRFLRRIVRRRIKRIVPRRIERIVRRRIKRIVRRQLRVFLWRWRRLLPRRQLGIESFVRHSRCVGL